MSGEVSGESAAHRGICAQMSRLSGRSGIHPYLWGFRRLLWRLLWGFPFGFPFGRRSEEVQLPMVLCC